jgi:phage terminase small subunit
MKRRGERLSDKQRAFVAAYEGPGTGTRAAIAAGYGSSEVTANRAAQDALRNPKVLAALTERARVEGRPELAQRGRAPSKATAVAEVEPAPPRAGKWAKKIGTTSERVAILMEIARDPKASPKDRIDAIDAAAKILGEVGPRRAVRIVAPPPPSAPPPTPAPAIEQPSAGEVSADDLEMADEDRRPHKVEA